MVRITNLDAIPSLIIGLHLFFAFTCIFPPKSTVAAKDFNDQHNEYNIIESILRNHFTLIHSFYT